MRFQGGLQPVELIEDFEMNDTGLGHLRVVGIERLLRVCTRCDQREQHRQEGASH